MAVKYGKYGKAQVSPSKEKGGGNGSEYMKPPESWGKGMNVKGSRAKTFSGKGKRDY